MCCKIEAYLIEFQRCKGPGGGVFSSQLQIGQLFLSYLSRDRMGRFRSGSVLRARTRLCRCCDESASELEPPRTQTRTKATCRATTRASLPLTVTATCLEAPFSILLYSVVSLDSSRRIDLEAWRHHAALLGAARGCDRSAVTPPFEPPPSHRDRLHPHLQTYSTQEILVFETVTR